MTFILVLHPRVMITLLHAWSRQGILLCVLIMLVICYVSEKDFLLCVLVIVLVL